MTTLAQIGFTTLGGSSILLVTMCLFGCAIRVRSPLIAPRATARPKSVIYSPYDKARGNPWWGWIGWSLRLSYDTLLQGIPGTGTREAGLRGSLLRVNLDGIVLLRFHAVCLRVASVATVLFVTLLVPAFYSAQCYRGPATMIAAQQQQAMAASDNNSTVAAAAAAAWPDDDSVLFDLPEYCSQNITYNLTDYERTTIKNVPSIENQQWTQTIFLQQDGILWRLYATVICFAVVAAYLCHQLQQEWIQILAMRRVYYLEYDIWGERREELKQTMLLDDYYEAGADPKQPRAPERHLIERDPWIPHPEQRETVPNIAIYSILVGGLPSLPEQAADSFNAQATIQFSKRESIDWQLSLTTTFFDHCVPNQPGFSSSIAAVTIIPSAQDLSVAWRKWYAAASKLRRLRFIRHQISLKRHYDIEEAVSELDENEIAKYGYGDENAVDEIDYGYGDGSPSKTPKDATTPVARKCIPDTTSVDYGYDEDLTVNDNAPSLSISTSYDNTASNDVVVTKPVDFGYEPAVPDHAAHTTGAQPTPRDIYSVAKNRNYFQQVLGAQDDDDQDHIYSSNEFGPEQAAVYAREFAQAAAPCCPVGCMEGRIRRAGIDQLLELERITAMEVHEANLDLRAARRRATRADTVFTQRQSTAVHAHSCIQMGVTNSREKKNAEELLDDASDEDLVPLDIAGQQLRSRYNRKQSMDNAMESNKEQRVARLNQLENVVPGDLGLEAKLFKKADLHGSKRNPSMSNGPPTTNNTSMRTKHHRKTPSLDGIEYPMHIATEAHLTSDSDGSASGSGHRAKPVLTTASRLSNIKENNSGMSSVAELDVVDERNASSAHWAQVETIITEANENVDMQTQTIPDGQWKLPNIRKLFSIKEAGKEIGKWAQQQSMDAVDNLARESTYAVVTFTSRQAAVAARSCLADGRGAGRWQTLKEIPIPPLSDAAPADLVTFRNCCRPVTLSINERQKNVRNYMAMTLLAAMYTFYTIPLTAAAALIDPKDLEKLLPSIEGFGEGNRQRLIELLSGLTTALIWSTFFALCPIFFKAIAHFGSKATSVANAEFKALQYYWWFMVLTAFTGPVLANMGLRLFVEGFTVASDFQTVLREIASTIPSVGSVSWLNWIIFRITVILPLNYLLQVNTFIFHIFGMNCCSRLVRGGGPGGPVPYRIYVDSGVVLMCVMALAPVSPIVAFASAVYFLVCQPLLRRNLIFLYRPKFDGGGFRWPFVFDMCISGLVVGEILLTVQMALKQAVGPTILAAMTIGPTFLFSKGTKEQYLRAFQDAALLQTSLLDGWDTAMDYSVDNREEFRQFLVDAHKAAYVPVCLAGTDTDEFLTAEPAIVVETEMDQPDLETATMSEMYDMDIHEEPLISPISPVASFHKRRSTQHGVTLRRAVGPLTAMRKRTNSMDSEHLLDQLNDDERSGISPFDRSMSTRNIHQQVPGNSFRSRTSSNQSEEDRNVKKKNWVTPKVSAQQTLIQPTLRGRRMSMVQSAPRPAPPLPSGPKVPDFEIRRMRTLGQPTDLDMSESYQSQRTASFPDELEDSGSLQVERSKDV